MLSEVKANGRVIKDGIKDGVKGLLFYLSPDQIRNNIEYRINELLHGVRITVENGREWLIDGYKEHECVMVKIEGKTYMYKVIEVRKNTNGTFDYCLELLALGNGTHIKPPRIPYQMWRHHSQIIGKA